MPSRRLNAAGREWRVFPSGFLTSYAGDEFTLFFVAGDAEHREVRVTRYSPRGARSREQSLADMSSAELHRLFELSQSSARAPEAGYQA
jgi:hypothetical protein